MANVSTATALNVESWLEVVREQVSLPDHAVAVVLLPDRRVMVEQHYKHSTQIVTLGLSAGYLNVGENPLRVPNADCAKR